MWKKFSNILLRNKLTFSLIIFLLNPCAFGIAPVLPCGFLPKRDVAFGLLLAF